MNELKDRIEKLKKSPLYQCEIVAILTDCQSEIERLERQLEAAETALKSIEDDMRYKPVQFDWPVWATKWLASIVDYFAQSQKGSK